MSVRESFTLPVSYVFTFFVVALGAFVVAGIVGLLVIGVRALWRARMVKKKKQTGLRGRLLSPRKATKAALAGMIATAAAKCVLPVVVSLVSIAYGAVAIVVRENGHRFVPLGILAVSGWLTGVLAMRLAARHLEPRLREAEREMMRSRDKFAALKLSVRAQIAETNHMQHTVVTELTAALAAAEDKIRELEGVPLPDSNPVP